jgi:hypothetical protein
MPRIPVDSLQTFSRRLIEASGATPEVADAVADSLVRADLAVHHSHGVIRISWYTRMVEEGALDPTGVPEVLNETPVTGIVEGHDTFGQVLGREAVEVGVGRDREALGLDERDEPIEVRVHDRGARVLGQRLEPGPRVEVVAVDVVDAPDRILEPGVLEERADRGLVRGVIIDLDGVVDPDVDAVPEPLDGVSPAPVRQVEVEAVVGAGLAGPGTVRDGAVIREPDPVEARVGGGVRHSREPATIRVVGVDVEVVPHYASPRRDGL